MTSTVATIIHAVFPEFSKTVGSSVAAAASYGIVVVVFKESATVVRESCAHTAVGKTIAINNIIDVFE